MHTLLLLMSGALGRTSRSQPKDWFSKDLRVARPSGLRSHQSPTQFN